MAWLVSIMQFLLINRFLLSHDLHLLSYFSVLVLFMLDLMLYILFYFEIVRWGGKTYTMWVPANSLSEENVAK